MFISIFMVIFYQIAFASFNVLGLSNNSCSTCALLLYNEKKTIIQIVFYILERILLDSGSDLLPSLFTVDALSWLDNILDKYNGKPMSMYKREANV